MVSLVIVSLWGGGGLSGLVITHPSTLLGYRAMGGSSVVRIIN